jgi:hypothetical protein
MSQHLSSEEISNWMLGERRADQERHARECARCSREIESLQKAFSLFRESGQRWADHWYVFRDARSDPGRRSRLWGRLSFAVSLAASVIAGILLLRPPAPYRPPEQAFVRVPYVAPPAPYERIEVMRMEVPVATLIAAGFEVHVPAFGGAVRADVLVGQDGRALAIRLLPDSVSKLDRRLNP